MTNEHTFTVHLVGCVCELCEARAKIERLEFERDEHRNAANAYKDEAGRLRTAIDNFVAENDAVHQPEWASEQAKANGKEPWCCTWCGAQDGGWPCGERMSIDELKEARRG